MKTRVLTETCQGHAMCALVCPDVFETDELTGHAHVRHEDVPPGLENHVQDAKASCPEGAIEIY